MTALTYGGETPTVDADEDTWGDELNTALGEIYADLQMLNTSPTARILGRNDSGSGEVERLTGTEVTALLDAVAGDSGSGGTKGLVPAPASGDAAAGKVLTAAGTWGTEIKAWGMVTGTSIIAGRNTASVTNPSTGEYAVTFTAAIGTANYGLLVTVREGTFTGIMSAKVVSQSSTGFTVKFGNNAGGLTPDGFNYQVLAA